ncbi:glucokinase [Blastococcus fimeti]|nr:glucokinase [Blastococcus fimeti]
MGDPRGAASASVVGLDVGGTGIKGARFDLHGAVLERLTVPTPAADGPAAVMRAVAGTARALARPDTVGVGVCTAGLVDPTAGIVRYAANLGLCDAPLARVVREAVGLPVTLEHDARAACLAEHRLGSGRGVEDLLLVVLGTGLSAGVVTGGRIAQGALGFGGEIGHAPVHPDGEACPCGQRGCLEVYASAGGIVRRYRSAGGTPELDAADIAGAVDRDPLAGRIWAEGMRALGHGLLSAILLLDPALVVLAGGLTGAGERLLEPVRAAVSGGLAWREPPRLTISTLGGEAGLHGAALGLLEQHRPEGYARPRSASS